MEYKTSFALPGFLIYLCLFQSLRSEEPRCSMYSHEVSSLEHIIRTEVKLEEMKRDISNQKEAIKHTKRNAAATYREINSQLADMENVLKEKESNMENLIEDLRGFKDKNAIATKDLPSTPVVIFRARTLADSTLTAGQTLVFQSMEENTGDGYNKYNGVFTAPVAGMYHFTVQLCLSHKTFVHWDIVMDGRILTAGTFSNPETNARPCASADVSSIVGEGMRVWVRCPVLTAFLFGDRYHTNMFSGYLVYSISQP